MSAPDPGFHEQLTIETPEQTALQFPLAGIGSRFLAMAYDTALQILVSVGLGIVFGVAGISGALLSPTAGLWFAAAMIFAFFVIYVGYFAIFEILWNGQTPGKRKFHLRAIQDSGRPMTIYQAIGRNLMRLVDQLPGVYALGIIVSLISPQNKRLGDYVAGTVVVREDEQASRSKPDWTKEARASTMVFQASRLSAEEHRLIETFLERRSYLDDALRVSMARQIADRIGESLGIPPEQRPGAESFLESVAVERRQIGV